MSGTIINGAFTAQANSRSFFQTQPSGPGAGTTLLTYKDPDTGDDVTLTTDHGGEFPPNLVGPPVFFADATGQAPAGLAFLEGTITLDITPVNDAPTITVGAGDSTTATLGETDAVLTASDTLTVGDIDIGDTVNASVTAVSASGTTTGAPPNPALLAMLTVAPPAILDTGEFSDTLTWTFDSGTQAFDYLAVGESLELTYTVEVEDSQGATDTETVAVTVDGTNDGPTIGAADLSGAATEDAAAPALTDSGAIAFADLDLSNTHTVSVALKSTTHNSQLGALSAAVSDASTGDGAGTITWDFSVSNAAVQFLGTGDTVVETYTVTLTDKDGATQSRDVAVTLTGTNDAIVIGATDLSGTVTEDAATPTLSDSGTIAFTDLDLSDVHTVTATLKGTTHSSQLGALTATVTNAATGDGAGAVTWNFSIANSAVQFLGAGDTVVETYTVTLTDNEGSTQARDVAVTINGTNDAPTLAAGTAAAVEDGPTVNVDLATLGADADSNDDGTTLTYAIVGAPAEGSATISGTTLTFDPGSDFQDLADGESRAVVIEVRASDGQNAVSNTASVTVTVTGGNDTPTVTLVGSDSASESIDETNGGLTASGTVTVGDVDTSDIVTATVHAVTASGKIGDPATPSNATLKAMLSILPVAPTAVLDDTEASDSLAWTFNSETEAFNYLAAGESLVLDYTVRVADDNSEQTDRTLKVTINGTNDAFVIGSQDLAGAGTEDAAGTLTDSGTIAFTDVDFSDVHSASAAFDGTTHSIQLGSLSADVTDSATGDGAGTVTWDFSVANADVQFLGLGDTVVETYTVTLTDNEGSTQTRDVDVTITGTNDAVVIGATDLSGAVTEDAAGTLTDSGIIAFTDLDLSDIHSVSATLKGTTHTSQLGALSPVVSNVATGDGAGEVTWDYSVANSAVQFLGAGATVVETYTVTLTDNEGSTQTRDVAVTITGTNDQPSATNINNTYTLNEDPAGGSFALTEGIVVSDPDLGSPNADEVITVTLSLKDAVASPVVPGLGTLTGTGVTSDGSGVWTTSGTVSEVNNALTNLTWVPVANREDDVLIDVSITDGGGGGVGPLTGQILLDVQPVNDAPNITKTALHGGAMQFDGTNDVVSGTSVSSATQDFTVEALINWDGTAGGVRTIASNGDLTNGGYALQLDTQTGALRVETDGGSFSAGTVTEDTWVHVAAVNDAGTFHLYINGDDVGSQALSVSAISGSTLIGASDDNTTTGQFFPGLIDEVRFWDAVRTETNLDENRDNQLTGSETGLVANYRFDERVGETLIDEAGSNDLSFKRDGTDPLQVNTLGRAVEFDGADQVVTVSDDSTLDLTTGATIEFWVNASKLTGTQAVLAKGDGGPMIVQFSGSSLQWVTDHGGTGDTQTSSGTLNSAKWHHVAVTFDNAAQTKAIYIDGALDSTKSVTAGALSTNALALSLGAALDGGGKPINEFEGILDQVAIFDHARTAAEIKLDMTEPLTGGESGLVAYYDFAEASGDTVQDGSGNGNAGTISGASHVLTSPDIDAGSALELRTAEDTSASGFLTANDPIEGHDISYSVSSQATNGTVSIDADTGQWIYTPNDNYTGTDAFTLRMQDNPPGPDANDGPQSVEFKEKVFDVTVGPADELNVPASLPGDGEFDGLEDTNLAFENFDLTGFGNDTVEVELRVSNGTLTVRDDRVGGLVASDITNNGTSTVSISGTIDEVNATFDSGIGTVYRGNEGYNGSDTVEIRVVYPDGTAEFESFDLDIDSVNDSEELSIGVAQFDGSDDNVTVADIDLDNRSFTWEMWVNRAVADSSDDLILDHRVAAGVTPGADEYSTVQAGYRGGANSNEFIFQFDGGAARATAFEGDGVGEWVHWAGSYDASGNTITLYKDAVAVGSATTSKTYIGAGDLTLGIGNLASFGGMVDEFRLWDGVRSANEIAANYNQIVDRDDTDLIAYYRFDEPFADDVARDLTDNAHDGTFNNGADQIHAPIGRALDFDGSDDVVTVAHAAALAPTSAITIEAWISADSLTGTQVIASKGSGTDGYRLTLEGNQLQFDIDGGSATTTATLNLGQWHHVGASYDDSTGDLKLIIDGEIVTTSNVGSAALTDDTAVLTFGDSAGGSEAFNGRIAEVRIWDTALDAGTIDRFYNQPIDGTDPPSVDLVGLWTFDEISGATAPDAVGGFDGTISGATRVDTAPDVLRAEVETLSQDDLIEAITQEEVAVRGYVDGDDVSATQYFLRNDASNGTVTVDQTSGAWVYIPDDDFRGTDTFRTRANGDGNDREWVTVEVRPLDAGRAHGGVAQFGVRDGTPDAMTTESAVDLSGSFSFEFWGLRADTAQAGTARLEDGDIALSQGSGAANQGLHIGFQDGDSSGSTFVFGFDDEASANALTYADTDDNLDAWVHWAGTYDASTNERILYKNGIEVASDTAPADYAGTGTLTIGDAVSGLGGFAAADGWHGQLDEIRVWSGVRTAREIADNYNQVLFDDPGDSTKLDDLLLHFDFDDRTGTTADNVAGSNDATFQSGSAAPAFFNLAGRALDFDGSGDSVSVAHASELSPTSAITIEAWILPTSITGSSGSQVLVHKTGGTDGYQLRLEDNNLRLTLNETDSLTSTATLQDGVWHHVAATYDEASGVAALYIDGALDVSSSIGTNLLAASSTALTFGDTSGGGAGFDGLMDEVRIWNTARTAGQIDEFYNQPLLVADQGSSLVGYWTLDDLSGNAQDATANDNDGTITDATRADTAPILYGQVLRTQEEMALAGSMTSRFTDAASTEFDVISDPTNGTLVLDTVSGAWRYLPNDDFEATDTFRIRAEDGDGFEDDELFTVTIDAVNDQTTATNTTQSHTFDEDSVLDLTNIVVTDPDTNEQITATLTLDDPTAGVLTTGGGGSYDSGTGVWTITGSVTTVNTALAAVTFDPTQDREADTHIDVDIRDGLEAPASSVVTGQIDLDITPLNDQTTATNTTQSHTFDGSANVDLDNIVVSDPDPGDQITVKLTLADTSQGALTTGGGGSYNSGTGEWSITGTTAQVNAALAAVEFAPAAEINADTSVGVNIQDGLENGAAPVPGTITLNLNRPPTVENYNPGSALVLDGASAVATSPTGQSGSIQTGNFAGASHTIEAWVQTTETSVGAGLIALGNDTFEYTEMTIGTGGVLRVTVFDGTGSARTFETTQTINDGAWHHIAYSYNAGTDSLSVYVDGAAAAGTMIADNAQSFSLTDEPLFVGVDNTGANAARVAVDEVRVWSDVRTAQEIADNYQGQVATDEAGLFAYYRMDDRLGSTVTDSAQGGTNDLTLSGGAYFASPDRGVSLDGTDDHVSLGAGAINDLSAGTIEAWIYLDGNTEETITAKQSDGEDTYALFTIGHSAAGAGDAGRLYFQGQDGTVAESTTLVSTDQWTHVAVAFTSTVATFYVNGQVAGGTIDLLGDFSVPNDPTVTTTTIGGWLGSGTGSYFDGLIDELRVWSVARSGDDIRDDMNDQLTGSETGLEAYWRFNETSGTTADDLAGSNDGTLENDAAFAQIGADVSGTHVLTSPETAATLFHAAIDPDGDSLSVGSPTDPPKGSAVRNPDGSFTYAPDAGTDDTTDSFSYQVSDDNGGQADVSASVEIV